jgi:MFS family permease
MTTTQFQKKNQIPVKSKAKVYILGLTISLCGFYFGFSLTEFNNFFEYFMKGKFNTSIKESRYHSINAYLNTYVTLGGLLCVFLSGFILQKLRLKTVVIITCIVHITARIGMVLLGLNLLYVCRFIIGFVICFNSFTCPIYIADLLPKRFIGFLGSCYVGFMSLGIIVAMFMKYSWTISFWWTITLIPAFLDFLRVILLGVVFNYESPKSLVKEIPKETIRISRISNYGKNINFETSEDNTNAESMDEKEVKNPLLGLDDLKNKFIKKPEMQRYLEGLYDEENFDKVIDEIMDDFENSYGKKKKRSMFRMVFNKSYRLQFFIAVVVNALNQLTGINAINFYSKIIFKQLHFSEAETLTILCGKHLFIKLRALIFRLRIRCWWNFTSFLHVKIRTSAASLFWIRSPGIFIYYDDGGHQSF